MCSVCSLSDSLPICPVSSRFTSSQWGDISAYIESGDESAYAAAYEAVLAAAVDERPIVGKRSMTLVDAVEVTLKKGFVLLRTFNDDQLFFEVYHFECGNIKTPNKKNFVRSDIGCSLCADIKRGEATRQSEAETKSACESRGFEYISRVREDSQWYVNVRCPTCGEIFKTSLNTARQISNCRDCSYLAIAEKNRYTDDYLAAEAKKKGYVFIRLYRLQQNGTTVLWVDLICKYCDEEYPVRWTTFVNGVEHYDCAREKRALNSRKSESEIKSHCDSVDHEYLEKEYRIQDDRRTLWIRVVCPTCAVKYWIRWDDFYKGLRCGTCNKRGFDKSLPGILYYLRFKLDTGEYIYKIGITNFTVDERFKREPLPYDVIAECFYEDGAEAYKREQEILKFHKEHQYKGSALRSGNTECFVSNVLGVK